MRKYVVMGGVGGYIDALGVFSTFEKAKDRAEMYNIANKLCDKAEIISFEEDAVNITENYEEY